MVDVLENLAIAKYMNGIIEKDGELYKVVSLSQPSCKVLIMDEDEMEIVIECPNCHQPTKYGRTRMISGHVGCDNAIGHGKICFWDDLLPRIMKEREEN